MTATTCPKCGTLVEPPPREEAIDLLRAAIGMCDAATTARREVSR